MSNYVAFLVLGVILVAIDGQLIYRSGLQYLARTNHNDAAAASLARLISVLFHLVMLGLLALLSTVSVPVSGAPQQVVTRLGILLLVLAAGHGLTILILANIKGRQQDRRIAEKLTDQYDERTQTVVGTAQPHDRPIYTPLDTDIPSVAPDLYPEHRGEN